MPGLFEQFPHTNLHELNLDWMIDLLNTFKDELENRAVLSVNGMTGEVTLYESENVVLPPLTEASSWRLVRMMDGQYVGVLFQDGHVWLQQGNSTLKLLTTEDIPTSAGVVSINGRGGIVTLTGADIPIDDSADPDSVRLALENESIARQDEDSSIRQAIASTNANIASKEWNPQDGDSLLTWLLTNIPNRAYLPFSFVKIGTGTAVDGPFSSGLEYTGIVEGHDARLAVVIDRFGGSDKYYRDIYQDHWAGDWHEIITITQFNNALTAVSQDALTASGDVVISMQRALSIGKQANYNLVVNLPTAKTRNTEIVTGLAVHSGGYNGVPTVIATDNQGNFAHFIVTDAGTLIAGEDIASGSWRMSFTYIKD